MKRFIFRNNTVEFFFGNKDTQYSGYDDISLIPNDADEFIWFYQVPIKEDPNQLVAETESYIDELGLVLSSVPSDKRFIIFTLSNLYCLQFTGSDFRLKESINNYNQKIFSLEQEHQNIKVLDLDEFLADYPSLMWIDWKYFFISQPIFNPRLAPPFKKWFNRKIEEIDQKRKKCLVLDLDNTLWGGVLGEDGIDGIKIGGDYPGKAFLFFQKALVELSKNGIILTICSKNNERDVMELWKDNPFMALKKEDIAAYRINWNNKADNIVALSKELNIGLDSMVFIDDNPTERELIRQALPMVETPEFPKEPYELPAFFKILLDSYFRVYSVTNEDKKKTEQYKANAARAKERSHFTDMASFLRSLQMKLRIEPLNDFNLPRIAQMTQKTNQFNLTTKRYTDADIMNLHQEGCKIWCISVEDKFGDNGITGLIIVKGNTIDELLLSCRILGKGIEFAFVKTILKALRDAGANEIYAEYIPTAKNSQVSDFYDRCGFMLIDESNQVKKYKINLSEARLDVEDYYTITIK